MLRFFATLEEHPQALLVNISVEFYKYFYSVFSSETKMMVVKCTPKYDTTKLKEEFFVKGAIEKVTIPALRYLLLELIQMTRKDWINQQPSQYGIFIYLKKLL